jgi:hypothetical protein
MIKNVKVARFSERGTTASSVDLVSTSCLSTLGFWAEDSVSQKLRYFELHYPLKRNTKWSVLSQCATTRIGHGHFLLLVERYLCRDELLAIFE